MAASAAIASGGCEHCGAPLTGSWVDVKFCCRGCETAYALLSATGLRDGYLSVLSGGRPNTPRADTANHYVELDHPKILAEHGAERASGVFAVDLVLEGVHCAACLWLLEKLPRVCKGVSEARLDLTRARLTVVFEPDVVRLSTVAKTLAELGYPPHLARDASRHEVRQREDRVLLTRIGVAFAVAANVMLMAVALYCGDTFGIAPEHRQLLRWGSLFVTLPSLFYAAAPFWRGAWVAMRTRTTHIDVPLALSLAAGYVQGIINTIRNSGDIYFDSVTALVFALLASRYVHRRKQREAVDATELLTALAPAVAHRRDADGSIVDVPTSSLKVDDVVEVRAGESFPVDGLVVDGTGCVDASLLSGESLPVDVARGDTVHAGTVCVSAPLAVRARATGAATRLAALTTAMERAASQRAGIVELADRLGGYFLVVAALLAVVTVAINWQAGIDVAFDRAVALLIVACPCALGLATPLAMSSAMASAARRRILIKTSAALERLTRVETVVFDKTGTLTTGKLSLSCWLGDRGVQPLVRALEQQVAHPIARALADALPPAPRCTVIDVDHATGFGISGTIDGEPIIVGRPQWVLDQTVGTAPKSKEDPSWSGMAAELAEQGLTPVLVARAGAVVAAAGLADAVRADARDMVDSVRRTGRRVQLVSGDDRRVVARVARALGIDAFEGGASPERKLQVVRDLERDAPVAMIGDGVNDAVALAAATVGVAVHGGAEASLAAADVYIDRPDSGAIALLFAGATRAKRVVQTGVVLGAVYNIVGVALAMTGVVTPLMAAVLMPAASLTVVTLAHSMRTFGEKR